MARVVNQLMINLGFGTGYVVQGGDVGSRVSRYIALQYDACKGNVFRGFSELTYLGS